MKRHLKEQGIPLILTVLIFFTLSFLLYGFILFLNLFPSQNKILLKLQTRDILVGFSIYLKTAIDFAIFIGNLMRTNPGWKKRIAIEAGTAIGNAMGTIIVLTLWSFFRQVPLLMAVMIILASLVLLRMAEESIGEFLEIEFKIKHITLSVKFLQTQIKFINKIFNPFLGKLIPNTGIINTKSLSFWNLAIFSFTIPFILGLDDFAGYIPLFSVINVFGFGVGVFLGHMILNLGLFLSPKTTTNFVKNPLILIIGGIAFVGIAIWGFYEALKIFMELFLNL